MGRILAGTLGLIFFSLAWAGPASAASPAPVPATFEELDGTDWRSTVIKGNGKKPKKIELYFTEGQAFWGDTAEEKQEIVPLLGLTAGCNWLGAGYQVTNGRVKWTSPAFGTLMACSDDRSRWIMSRLRLGMKATFVGNHLVLKRGRAIVRLKPAPARV